MVSDPARRYRIMGGMIMGGMIVMALLVLPRMAGSQEPTISDRMGVRHWSGQGVSPVYEGFDVNQDGTYNLWFGYMNLNWEGSSISLSAPRTVSIRAATAASPLILRQDGT